MVSAHMTTEQKTLACRLHASIFSSMMDHWPKNSFDKSATKEKQRAFFIRQAVLLRWNLVKKANSKARTPVNVAVSNKKSTRWTKRDTEPDKKTKQQCKNHWDIITRLFPNWHINQFTKTFIWLPANLSTVSLWYRGKCHFSAQNANRAEPTERWIWCI